MTHKNSGIGQGWLMGVNALLTFLLCACSSAASSTATPMPQMPDTLWQTTESPLFPNTWPPTSATIWTRYTFAYGHNPAKLIDGAYVTLPLAKTDWTTNGVSTTITLSNNMTQAAIQGVVPLDAQAQADLSKGQQISNECLKLIGLPDTNVPETKDLLTYYRAWFKYNGAFLGLIRQEHAAFINWVTQGK